MLRCLVVLLALALLLGGCVQNAAEPPAPTEKPSEPAASAGIYMEGSSMEQSTNGAIRAFRLGSVLYYDCVPFGDGLLLMHASGTQGKLTLYRGEKLEFVREVNLGENVLPTAGQLQIYEQGLGYYDPEGKAVVFLNTELIEARRISMQETPQGSVYLSPDGANAYYCTEQGIRVMDLQTGIARMLRQQTAAFQEITGVLGNGEMLRCHVELENGEKQIRLIDTQNGLQKYEGLHFESLQTGGTQYCFRDAERGVERLRFGNGAEHQVLWPAEQHAEPTVLFANNAIVMAWTEWDGARLVCYDLQTGQRRAEITLPGISKIQNLRGDGKGGIWMFAGNRTEGRWLYHWNTEKSLTEDPTDYSAPLYTMTEPDREGLAELAQSAREMGDQYGVEILLWEEAAQLAPENYTFTEEYLTRLYQYYLPRLEQALAIFPREIFTKSAEKQLKIGLVRDISGDPALGTLPTRSSIQFWDGETPVVVLTLGEDLEQELHRSIYLYMETRMLSKSSALYEWYRLNPKDFDYDEDYISNLGRTDTTYTEGENPYFIDLFSMSFAREDRATVFAYACMREGEGLFSAPVLQEKLERICKAIREAYGLKKVPDAFLWEAYLQ